MISQTDNGDNGCDDNQDDGGEMVMRRRRRTTTTVTMAAMAIRMLVKMMVAR